MTLDAPEHRSGTPRTPVPRRHPAAGLAITLSWVVTGLVACASLTGLVLDDVYAGAAATAEMLRGFDLVAAVVVVPLLALAAHRARNCSVAAHLVMASLVAYVVYTYAYYLFGTGFNDLFLLHAATFAAGLAALGAAVASLDVDWLAGRFRARGRMRLVAGILGVLAAALGGMWIYLAIDNAGTGDVPAGSRLVETDTVVHLGMALDLTLLVPLYAVTAVLLWRGVGWGYALAGLALVAGLLHQLSYVVAMPFQVAAGVPGAVAHDPFEPVIVLLYLAASALLLRGGRARDRTARPSL